MNILYIHQYFATPQGATGTRSYEIARAMQRAGHKVTMLTSAAQLRPEQVPPGDGTVRRGVIEGIPCVVLIIPYEQRMSYMQRIGSFLAFMAWACRVVLTVPRIDLVYATSTPLTVGVPALLAKWGRAIPYVFEVRDLWPDIPAALGVIRGRFPIWTLGAFEKTVYRQSRFVVAVNDDMAAAVRSKTNGRTKTIVVSNACDTDLFRPDRDGSAFRRQHGWEDAILCVHPGAMGPVNGLDSILDAACRLRDVPRLRFIIIGKGNQRPRLERRIRDEGLQTVRILDPLPKHDLADALATADIGLMTVAAIPILEWNCANKFFDYLASGLPVVLNYRGWQARLLAQHRCGLSADAGDLDGFVAAIRELAGDVEQRHRMGSNARRLAETDLNRQTVVQPLLAELKATAGTLGAR